ncbi:MAG: peptide chain release factor 2 [Armatimonadota bacterium]|nr:MAG: peptide chain release factor 2 [Armatimonadota bacterium]
MLNQAHELRDRLDLSQREQDLKQLEQRAAAPNLWDDPLAAQRLHVDIGGLKREIEPMRQLLSRAEDISTLAQLAEEEGSDSEAEEIEAGLAEIEAMIAQQELLRLFTGEYDAHNALLSINAGAGGTESCDWVDMLARMYGRWAEGRGYGWEIIDHNPGEEAGSRGITASITGDHAYGRLKGERGVHRLVRISPFDAASRRHPSFASVDVIPEVEEADEVEISSDDLKIDTFRATGAGGQHVNKTDSAVRITHLPTGLVVSCQNERSQHKNRTFAMRVLKARLLERQRQEQEKRLVELRGEQTEIAWGHQIRSYVLHPYQMTKDHRTGHETSNTAAILEGEIDGFLESYLRYDMARRAREGAN